MLDVFPKCVTVCDMNANAPETGTVLRQIAIRLAPELMRELDDARSAVLNRVNLEICIGDVFGRWEVIGIKLMMDGEKRRTFAECRCKCGSVKFIRLTELKKGKTVSCGCLRDQICAISLAKTRVGKTLIKNGDTFGRLTVINAHKTHNRNSQGGTEWFAECLCKCGQRVDVRHHSLLSHETRSCGCYKLEVISTHKMSGSPTYRVWNGMLQRCTNPNSQEYYLYGGRGILVCERWNKFEHFLEDMGVRPTGTTIDRINNDGNYEPGNCRWATPKQQAINRRTTKFITFKGETMCLSDFASKFGMHKDTLSGRLARGMSVEDALTTPLRNSKI